MNSLKSWTLSDDEKQLSDQRTQQGQLGLALLLKFFQVEGRFPHYHKEVPMPAVGYVAEQLEALPAVWFDYPLKGCSGSHDREQLHAFLGFRQYGNLEQFENRILNPKLRSATKAALSRFPANKLIQERQTVVAEIMDTMTGELAEFPITINLPQLENIELPRRYVEAVEAKETSREEAEREKHVLEQQSLQALQAVNSAEADATAKKLAADAEAYRVRAEAEAEAAAIEMITVPTGEKSGLHPPGDRQELERCTASHHAGFKHPAPVAVGRPRKPVDGCLPYLTMAGMILRSPFGSTANDMAETSRQRLYLKLRRGATRRAVLTFDSRERGGHETETLNAQRQFGTL